MHEIDIISKHVEISLNSIIDKVQCQLAALLEQKQAGSVESGLDGRIKQFDDRLFELNGRLERRREDLIKERECTIGSVDYVGCAWALPHPERNAPAFAPMVRDDEVEKIAVKAVTEYEQARGWQVESIENQNRGFDLISRKPHSEDPQTFIEVRFIEVKGRSSIGEIAVTTNEYKTAERLKKDYWLYAVFNCDSKPEIHPVQNPVRLGWQPLVKIEHYHVGAEKIVGATT